MKWKDKAKEGEKEGGQGGGRRVESSGASPGGTGDEEPWTRRAS